MHRLASSILAGLLLLVLSATAQASLILRGGGLVYDDVLDITWLEDANYAKTSGYTADAADGSMTWDHAMSWAAGLSYYDSARGVTWNDWRLPSMQDHMGIAGCDTPVTGSYNGTDCGYNVLTTGGGTVHSEMASLFYDTLGNLGVYDTNGNFQPGFGLGNTGPFTNMQISPYYWFGVEDTSNLNPNTQNYDYAWYFGFNEGFQDIVLKSHFGYAWAVRDGDVVGQQVPAPATPLLIAAGLLGIAMAKRRRGGLNE